MSFQITGKQIMQPSYTKIQQRNNGVTPPLRGYTSEFMVLRQWQKPPVTEIFFSSWEKIFLQLEINIFLTGEILK